MVTVWKSWLIAARPKTLPAAIVPVWSGCLMTVALGFNVSYRLAALTLMGAIFIQIATNFFNDVIDASKGADTSERAGPTRATASGLLSPKAMYIGAAFMLSQALLCGFFLLNARGWPVIAMGIPSLYLSYGYTGGPIPLAYRGLGELFVVLFFGLLAVMGTIFIQIGLWPWQGCILGLQIGCLSAVLIAVNNYRDLEEDEIADKRTLAVRWGRRPVAFLIFFMTVLPSLLVLIFEESQRWFLTSFVLAISFLLIESKLLKSDGVSSRLLGLSALHLILFVGAQHLFLALT